MSVFNPELFNNLIITESNQTTYVAVPEGDAVAALVSEVKPVRVIGEKGSIGFDIEWDIIDRDHLASANLEAGKVYQTIWLDLTPQGTLDTGVNKNVGLGRLREAVGLNTPGQEFSFGMLRGRQARIKIRHRTSDDGKITAQARDTLPM